MINFEGTDYDLSHFQPWSIEIIIPEKDHHPELALKIEFRFSNHCYTEELKDHEPDSTPSLTDQYGNRRRFCPVRYKHSLKLRDILQDINTYKCLFTGRSNWLIIEVENEKGEWLNYHVYLLIKPHRSNGGLFIRVVSAYIKDKGNNQPKRKSRHNRISFCILARKMINGEPVRRPPSHLR